jgi:hypothetical protein
LGTLPSSGSMHRWFPEVVPGEASGIACRKCAAAAPVVPEGQFRTRRDAIKVAPGQVTRTPVTVSGLHRGCTESEHRARLTVVCFAPIIFCRIHLRVRAAEYRLSRSGKLDQAASFGLGPAVPSGPDTASDSYVFASSGNSPRMMPITCSSRTGTSSWEICHTTAQSTTKYRCTARFRNALIYRQATSG